MLNSVHSFNSCYFKLEIQIIVISFNLCLFSRALEYSRDPSSPVAVPLRMLEVFTDVKSCSSMWKDEAGRFVKLIMVSLIQKGIFQVKIPPKYFSVCISPSHPGKICALLWRVFITVGDTISTMEDIQFHKYCR